MSEEIKLDLKKPLDKMTAKELREMAMKNLPAIVGASGMGKDELLTEIKAALGITEEKGGVSPYKSQILSAKAKIRELRVSKETLGEESSRKSKDILRRKINKLKKRTRRLAAAAN